jgi:hypothetical protein
VTSDDYLCSTRLNHAGLSSRQNGFCVLHHESDSEHQRNNDEQRARTVVSDSRKRRGRNGTGLCWLALPKELGTHLTAFAALISAAVVCRSRIPSEKSLARITSCL